MSICAMTRPASNGSSAEMRLIYMNRSIIPLTCHELVAAMRHRTTVTMLVAMAVLLALPSVGVLQDLPLWMRINHNFLLGATFLWLFPALLLDAIERRRRAGKARVYLLTVSVPAALLTILLVEAIDMILMGTTFSHWSLLTRLGVGVVCFEVMLLLVIWFFAPILVAEHRKEQQAQDTEPRITIGTLQVVPSALRRIETDGRHLHLHLDGSVETVTAALCDVIDELSPYGLLVHRCHWVAFDQIGTIKVKGRSYEMITRQGDRVQVARDRRKAIASAQDGLFAT